ncbi:uncharacterized protein LOC105175876 isoform X2 [Sesamum indicum]|nr:uncharacterized protein LOC105175876 isoform X2 [Sesamum indicum]XP_011096809.1 uncharacterized protein LOC105175876 isoform X2 [Sesamum indicum]
MEFDEDNGAAGSIPEFGAIFMSNAMTKKECFRRRIFALPSSKAEFVKHVKAGMVLFLFEFEKRQLFGVYQASTDGAMDIVPHGFKYSGKHFPAQVCFTPIWYCDPLPEREFRDAIRENYFSAKKFNFGLSEDQVRRLLSLFSSRKLKNKIPSYQLAEVLVGAAGKDRGLVGDDRFASEREYIEPTQYDEFNSAVFCDYQSNSLARANEDEVLMDDVVNTEGELRPFAEGDILAKRRRIDNDVRLITNDLEENGIYNHGILRPFHIDSPKHSSDDEVRRFADVRRLLTVERVRNEEQVDKVCNPVLSPEYTMDPLNVRTNDDDRVMQRNRLFGEYNIGNSFGRVFANDHYGKPLDKSKHQDDRFLLDHRIQRGQSVCDSVKHMSYSGGNLNLQRPARELIDDHQCSMNWKLKSKNLLNCDLSPVSAFEHSARLMHKVRNTTSVGIFPVSDRIESQPDFGTSSIQDFSSENSAHLLNCGRRIIQERKYPIVEGRLNESMMDSILSSPTLARNTGYIPIVDGRVVDHGRFRKIERVDNEEDIHTVIKPVNSREYPSFSKQKQSLSSFSDKLLPENGLSQLTVTRDFYPSHSKFGDATITRAVPYIPEKPNFSQGCRASTANNKISSLVRENHPQPGSLGNFYSLSNTVLPPYFLESEKFSRSLDISPECGNRGLELNTSGHQSSLPHVPTSSILNADLSMHMNLNASPPGNYQGLLFPKCSLTSLQSSDRGNTEGEKRFFGYASRSSESHSIFARNLPTASERVIEDVPRQDMNFVVGKDLAGSASKDYSVGVYHPERDLASYKSDCFGNSRSMNLGEHHGISKAPDFNSNVKRRSVFTRLNCKLESHVGEERNDSHFNGHDCYMDASADEVMDILQQVNNPSPRNLRVVGAAKHGENAMDELIQSHNDSNHSRLEKKKLNNACVGTVENIDEMHKETRMVDFKRRSETKKSFVRSSICSVEGNKITGISEEVESSMKKTLKRKKLIRPVFRKVESSSDIKCSNQNLRLPGQGVLNKDDKQSRDRAFGICGAEMLGNDTKLRNVLASSTNQSTGCNTKKQSNPEEQKELEAHLLPSIGHEFRGHKTPAVGLQIGTSPVQLNEKPQCESSCTQTSDEGMLCKDNDAIVSCLNLEESAGLRLGAGCRNNLIEEKKFSKLKSKKKIRRTNKKGTEPSQ